MVTQKRHRFGGDWTADKIERVRKYLVAYARIMHKQEFRFAYIDAFAGTGYRTPKRDPDTRDLLPELAENETQDFLKGSARVALEVEPHFHSYIFIDSKREHVAELEKLKEEFPDLAERIGTYRTCARSPFERRDAEQSCSSTLTAWKLNGQRSKPSHEPRP
jgi:three-Cys-motif partner protein